MAGDAKEKQPWKALQGLRWHQWARMIAGALLMDQAVGPLTSLPPSDAIVIACIGALFAPVPVERK